MIAELPYIHRLKSVVLRQQRIKIFDEVAHKQQIASCFSSFETLESIRQKLDNAFLASELDYETP